MPKCILSDQSVCLQGASSTKERIIQATSELLISHGYRGMSLLDLASYCEINKSTLYLHFKSKSSLIDYLFERGQEDNYYNFNNLLQQEYLSNIERVGSFAEFLKKFLTTNQICRSIFITSPDLITNNSDFRMLAQQYMNTWLTLLHEIFKPMAIDADILARRILNHLQGSVISSHVFQDTSNIDILCEGLAHFTVLNIN